MMLSLVLVPTLLGLMGLCVFTLRQDARQQRIDRHLANALAFQEQVALTGPVTLMARQHTGPLAVLLRLVWGYSPDAPRTWPVRRTIIVGIVVGLASFVFGSMVYPAWLMGILAVVDASLSVRLLFRWQRRRYGDRLLRQLPDVVEFIISAVRAGLPVTEAFRIIGQEVSEPSRGEFQRVSGDLAMGRRADEALRTIYQRTGIEEYAIFAVTLAVQSKSGGRLAETLQLLGDAIRERIALAGRAKALAGEASLSAKVLGALPIVSAVVMYIERPESFDMLFRDPRGRVMVAVGITTLVLGILTMRRMIQKGTSV
jgi:tight adherence protein B